MSHNGFGSPGPVPSSRHQLSVPADSWTRMNGQAIRSQRTSQAPGAITCDGRPGKRSDPRARGRHQERACLFCSFEWVFLRKFIGTINRAKQWCHFGKRTVDDADRTAAGGVRVGARTGASDHAPQWRDDTGLTSTHWVRAPAGG
ncbi:hypothetical protein B0H17DRAFT_1145544 [Mycena rosella]|uniref:Uncharacterized protein n=1 Tax=Mycena rosella TaxID=1033263 RepID=A0AAD7G4I9_MYCRO|nr:hypothetical protein B0H17DRAFT_1145544 [Mycena rosella]